MNIVWRPQPRQAAFMARFENEALYGGAAGGGKSDALVMEALRQVHIPHYKGLILRKTFPQLSELIDKTLNYYPRAFPKAKYNGGSHTWTFPSGAKIIFGAMQYTKDRTKYCDYLKVRVELWDPLSDVGIATNDTMLTTYELGGVVKYIANEDANLPLYGRVRNQVESMEGISGTGRYFELHVEKYVPESVKATLRSLGVLAPEVETPVEPEEATT